MVTYFCEICNKNISKANKAKHLKTQSHLKKQGGDLQTMSTKLPEFLWAKYKGENIYQK